MNFLSDSIVPVVINSRPINLHQSVLNKCGYLKGNYSYKNSVIQCEKEVENIICEFLTYLYAFENNQARVNINYEVKFEDVPEWICKRVNVLDFLTCDQEVHEYILALLTRNLKHYLKTENPRRYSCKNYRQIGGIHPKEVRYNYLLVNEEQAKAFVSALMENMKTFQIDETYAKIVWRICLTYLNLGELLAWHDIYLPDQVYIWDPNPEQLLSLFNISVEKINYPRGGYNFDYDSFKINGTKIEFYCGQVCQTYSAYLADFILANL